MCVLLIYEPIRKKVWKYFYVPRNTTVRHEFQTKAANKNTNINTSKETLTHTTAHLFNYVFYSKMGRTTAMEAEQTTFRFRSAHRDTKTLDGQSTGETESH